MRPSRRLLPLLLLALAAPARAGDEPRTVREGAWFRVVCHFEHDRAADDALAAVEAVGPVAAKLYGLPDPAPGDLLEVHLYRTVEDYEAADRALTGGAFRRNLAFAHHDSKSAHVALQPPVSEEVLDRLGLPYLTQKLLAHEASHVVRFRAMPAFRSHPMWLVDGAAIWIASQAALARKRIDGVEADPLSATGIDRAQRLLAEGRLPPVADLFHDRTGDLSFYERYDSRAQLFRFLASGPWAEGFGKVLRRLRRLGAGDDFADRLEARVVEATAPVDELDAAFRTWLRARKPAWREVFRSLDAHGSTWVQAAFPDANAIAWRTAPAGTRRYALEGSVEILPGANLQMNVLLDHTDAGFVSVALRSDGWLTVFDYASATDAWNRLGSVECEALKAKGPVPFELRVEDGRLKVSLGDGGDVLLEVALPGRAMDGPWGLGAQAGSCGVWHDVALRDLADGAR